MAAGLKMAAQNRIIHLNVSTFMPFASVIIPAYNASLTIGDAIRSVLQQSVGDFEVIVVDDGSTDNTLAVVRELGIEPVSTSHEVRGAKGPAAARNLAATIATGRWLCFLDADDVWLPNRLQALRDGDDGRTALVAHRAEKFGIESGLIGPDTQIPLRVQLLEGNPCCCSAVAVRREAFVGFDVGLKGVEDWHLWLRTSQAHPVKALADVVALYRVQSTSLMNGRRLSHYVQQYAKLLRRAPELRSAVSRSLTGYHAGNSPGYWEGIIAMLGSGFPREALTLVRRSALKGLHASREMVRSAI